MKFNEKLKEYRLKGRLSIEQLASKLNVSKKMVENGKRVMVYLIEIF